MNATKRLEGLYGTDVSAQLESMGLRSEDVVGPRPQDECVGQLRSESEKAFLRQVDRLNADREFRDAHTRVLKCRTNGWQDVPLEDFLTMLALLSVMPQGGIPAKTLQKVFAHGTGKTWKALKEFPERVRNTAREIEAINDSPFFSFRNWIIPSTVRGRVVGTQFSLLPGALRVYAAFVESLTAKLPVMAANQPMLAPPPRSRYSEWVFKTSTLVKAVTGRFHDPEVSALLNAADLVVNPGLREPRFFPQTLVDLRSRQKHKFRQT
jgi:hypothetical protein